MAWKWGRRADKPADPVEILTEGAAGSVDDLISALLRVDGSPDDQARRALRVLASRPRVVVRLDEHVRRFSSAVTAPVDRAARKAGAGPVSMVLASMHRDGRIRERAVAEMLATAETLATPDPGWLPFLVLRTADWVAPVRERARFGLAMFLADRPEPALPLVLPTALIVRAWHRGEFAYTQTLAALLLAGPALHDQLLAGSGVEQRRFLLETGLAHGWWTAEWVLDRAEADDVRVRARAAEIVCRQAVWNSRADALRRWTRHRSTEVRGPALIGLARLGRHTDVTPHLDDRAALIRAIARASARPAGVDAADHYRQAVRGPDPRPGAIAGLAEAGTTADAGILLPLLTHPRGRIRAHAVRALHALEAFPTDRAGELLRDPSPAVVREATTALRRRTGSLPADLAWRLLADPERVERRRAGYRLIQEQGLIPHLRSALLLATDPDPGLARRAVADATRIARQADGSSWRRPEETAELNRLTVLAADALGPETTGKLQNWLTLVVDSHRGTNPGIP